MCVKLRRVVILNKPFFHVKDHLTEPILSAKTFLRTTLPSTANRLTHDAIFIRNLRLEQTGTPLSYRVADGMDAPS